MVWDTFPQDQARGAGISPPGRALCDRADQVVGFWTDSSSNTHGFVYSISAATFTSVDDPSGVGETIVNGINDDGTLVGFYGPSACTGSSTCNGFIATPTK
jgi:hypothetical protein